MKINAATRLKASTECTAEEESDERHWLLRVKSVLRLAKGDGSMKIVEADQEKNTVVIQMKPQVYLDPTIMMKLLIIFKKEELAMVLTTHSNSIFITVGPEGFLEEQTGAKV